MRSKIGLEIHVQLNTLSKLFCSCSTLSNEPNSSCCVTCLGMPGSKPMLNKKALDGAVAVASALNCKINDIIFFSRKTYFYPDLSKNFQITQYEVPIGENGFVIVNDKKIRITRVHLEEDPASLVHPGTIQDSQYVLINYNRSGIPLVEIVTEPDMETPDEARELLRVLRAILGYLGVYDDDCIIKADANVSIEETGFIRVEVKNISGFKDIENALLYELTRQKNHGETKQHTRSYNQTLGITEPLRDKETEDDYGYIFEPDLVPYEIAANNKIELPNEKSKRFNEQYKIDLDDAKVICQRLDIADLFEKVALLVNPVFSSKWIRKELLRLVNDNNIQKIEMSSDNLASIISLFEQNKISDKVAQQLLKELLNQDFDVHAHVEEHGLQVSNSSELDDFCKTAIASNPKVVEDYKQGREEALNFLVGQVMRMSKGKADAKAIKEMMIRLLQASYK